jgi:hypothetical protein
MFRKYKIKPFVNKETLRPYWVIYVRELLFWYIPFGRIKDYGIYREVSSQMFDSKKEAQDFLDAYLHTLNEAKNQ